MGVVRTRRQGLGLLMAAGLWLVVVAPAAAAGDTPDQSQTVATRSNTMRTAMAQTFQAGANGQLDRVSLMLATGYGAVNLTVEIQSVSGGQPSGTVLGSTSLSGLNVACCNTWHDFTFSPTVPVSGGTEYAIVVRPTNNYLTWFDSYYTDYYPQGQLWISSSNVWFTNTNYGRDFCFKTFLILGGGTQPPVIAATNATVTAAEGSTATNSGTYSDPNGSAVTLTASTGSVSQTGTTTGTWTWTAAAADEAPSQSVTIGASDAKGGTASASFTYTDLAVPPTVTITGAPATGPEGTAIALTGKATSPSAADNAAGFTLNWTVSKNGNPYGVGTSTGTSLSVTPDDEGTFVVTLTAKDDGGSSTTATVSFTGANVAPTAEINAVTHSTLVLVPLQTVTFTGGFTDPGVFDTHDSLFDYGDGTPADTTSYPAGGTGDITDTYAYSAPGTYTATYKVTDDDGGTGTATTTVTVETPAQALAVIDGYVQSMSSLNGGEKNGLSAKLRAAEASAARGDSNATCNQLDAFMNDLLALTNTGQLSPADSAALSSSAWAVHRALGCTKVKVGWLTLSL